MLITQARDSLYILILVSTFCFTFCTHRHTSSRKSEFNLNKIQHSSTYTTPSTTMSASSNQSKADLIAERQANLPLPQDPPNADGLASSMDARNVNVGSGMRFLPSPSFPVPIPSHPLLHPHHHTTTPPQTNEQTPISNTSSHTGGQSSDFSVGDASSQGLREPATTDDVDMKVGRTGVEGLSGVPSDAVSRGKKDNVGTVSTEGADKGYPHKSDPSSGL